MRIDDKFTLFHLRIKSDSVTIQMKTSDRNVTKNIMYGVPYIVINLGFCKTKSGLLDIFTLASTTWERKFYEKIIKEMPAFFYQLFIYIIIYIINFINIAIVECLT